MAYVKTHDGSYLKNPTFMGDGWFIRCSDDDGLQFVIRSKAKKVKSVRSRIYKEMRRVGITGTLAVGGGVTSTAAFPPHFRGLVSCWSFAMSLDGVMPKLSVFPELRVQSVGEDAEVYGF